MSSAPIKVARKQGQPERDNPAPGELAERFDAVADKMTALASQLTIPVGHSYRFDRDCGRGWIVGHQGRFGMDISAYIGRTEPDMYDPDQIKVEVRVFLDEPRAHLWVNQGPAYNFLSKTLLAPGKEGPFVYAASYDELFVEITSRVNKALASARPIITE